VQVDYARNPKKTDPRHTKKVEAFTQARHLTVTNGLDATKYYDL